MNPTDPNHTFARLSAINVSEFVEKKAGFSYLSWPFAVAQLRLADPGATWEVRRFNGLPYLWTELGYFVEVAVTVQGITLSQIHPVLDGRNRPLLQPTPFDINTSLQRCLVKAIALHGLGLHVYAGEDILQHTTEQAGVSSTDAQPVGKPLAAANDGQAIGTPVIAPHPQRMHPTLTRAQQAEIHKLAVAAGVPLERVLSRAQADTLGAIRAADYPRLVRQLESQLRAA